MDVNPIPKHASETSLSVSAEITLSDTHGTSDSIIENNMIKPNEEVAKKESWKATDDKITARRR